MTERITFHADTAALSVQAEACRALSAENERLRAALAEAADDVASWGAYAGDYFREKWGLAGDVARIRAAAAVPTEETP